MSYIKSKSHKSALSDLLKHILFRLRLHHPMTTNFYILHISLLVQKSAKRYNHFKFNIFTVSRMYQCIYVCMYMSMRVYVYEYDLSSS